MKRKLRFCPNVGARNFKKPLASGSLCLCVFSMGTRVHHFQINLEPQSQLRSNFKPRPHMTITPLLFSKLSPTTTTSTSKLFQTLKTKPFSTSVTKLSFTKLRAASREAAQQLKDSWLDSLTCPLPISTFDQEGPQLTRNGIVGRGQGNWVIGVDPDVSGAIALLKTDDGFNYTAQVFDSPHLQVMVGKRARKRLDAKSMVQLLQSFDAPFGTAAYIEQSTPYPKDGKMGWWSGGFGYGLWIGVLVASGFSVIPVSSFTWKNEFQLSGNGATKDDSRRIASTLFPSLSSLLRRKKDHGRAEALLIAAYGKDLKIKSASPCMEEELP